MRRIKICTTYARTASLRARASCFIVTTKRNAVATTFVHHVIKYMRKQKKKTGCTAMTATAFSVVKDAILSTHRLQVKVTPRANHTTDANFVVKL
jgi:hypothetical protein